MSDFIQKTVIQAVDRQSNVLDNITKNTKKNFNAMESASKKVRDSVLNLRTAFIGFAGTKVIGSFIEVEKNLTRINNALTVGKGSAQAAKVEFAFLQKESNRLGLELQSTALSYAQLTAAAKNTNLTGSEQREIFLGVSEAGAALGLSAADMEGALRAVQQMISKGNVQAEELRGQLGERIPGAFSLAAKSMGVTEKEMNKLLETGKVTAEAMLPKLAAELRSTFGATASKGPETLNGKINTLSNTVNQFQRDLLEGGGAELLKNSFSLANSGVQLLGNNIHYATGAAKALFAVWSVKKIVSITKAIEANYMATRTSTSAIVNHREVVTHATRAQWGMNKAVKALSFAGPMIAIGAFQVALDRLVASQKQISENNNKLAGSIGGSDKKTLEQLIKLRKEYDHLKTQSSSLNKTNIGWGQTIDSNAIRLAEINKQVASIQGYTFDSEQGGRRRVELLQAELKTLGQVKQQKSEIAKAETGTQVAPKQYKSNSGVTDPRQTSVDLQAEYDLMMEAGRKQFEAKEAMEKEALVVRNEIRELELLAQEDSRDREIQLLENSLNKQLLFVKKNSDLEKAYKTKNESDLAKLKLKWDKKEEDLSHKRARMEAENSRTIAANYINAAQMIFGENKKFAILSKALAMGEAAVNTSVAFTKALPNIPLAASIGVLGGIQVAKIASTKFAEGGVVPGNQYNGDKINASLNSGEVVLNNRQINNLFRMLNNSGGNAGGRVVNEIHYNPQNSYSGGGDIIDQLKNEPEKFVEFMDTLKKRGHEFA